MRPPHKNGRVGAHIRAHGTTSGTPARPSRFAPARKRRCTGRTATQSPQGRNHRIAAAAKGPMPPKDRSRAFTCPGRTRSNRSSFFSEQETGMPRSAACRKGAGSREKKRTDTPNGGGPADRNKTTVRRQTDGWRRREGGPERKPGRMTHDTQVRATPRNALIQTRKTGSAPRTK